MYSDFFSEFFFYFWLESLGKRPIGDDAVVNGFLQVDAVVDDFLDNMTYGDHHKHRVQLLLLSQKVFISLFIIYFNYNINGRGLERITKCNAPTMLNNI